MVKIGLDPMASEAVDPADCTPEQLYDALDAWDWKRHYGRTRSEEATQFRQVSVPTLKAIRTELRRRKLPTTRPKREGAEGEPG